MKRLISIAILILLFSIPVYADEWTQEDTAWQATTLLIMGADWLQTKEIARNPKYTETNILLGSYPSQNEVDAYFLGCAIIHTTISYYLPKKYRRYWQYVFIGVEAGCVAHNINAGVKIKF